MQRIRVIIPQHGQRSDPSLTLPFTLAVNAKDARRHVKILCPSYLILRDAKTPFIESCSLDNIKHELI
jgi:hypothetical protein